RAPGCTAKSPRETWKARSSRSERTAPPAVGAFSLRVWPRNGAWEEGGPGEDPAPGIAMNEESIFLEALGKVDPSDRARFLDQACAGDAAQRQRIEKLLAAHPEAGNFLEQPAVPPGGTVAGAPAAGPPG